MVRKEIGSIFDRNNRNAINDNFEYLFEGSRRINELNYRADSVLNEAKKANDMNKNVQQQINTLIAESGTSDAEVLQARIDAEGNEYAILKERLDVEKSETDVKLSQKSPRTGMILEVPEQQSAYDKYKVDNDFTNKDDYYEDYINSKWEVLRAANPNYVTREAKGKDSSGVFDIYKYQISNRGNYKKTIFIQGGIHGSEKLLTFTLFDFAEELVNSVKNKNKYMEELFNNVRFVFIPVLNPHGFTRNRRQNYNEVDINRNYSVFWDTTDSGDSTAWYKGTEPFSEPESVISRDLVKEIRPDLFIDLHTIWSHTYDFYAESDIYNKNAGLLKTILDSAFAKKKEEYPEYVLPDGNIHAPQQNFNSTSYMHMSRILGVPSYSLEFCGDSFDGRYTSLEMTKALELLFNVVYYNYLETSYKFRNAHPRDSLGINKDNTPLNVYNFMDNMPLTKKTFGKDASGIYDIHYYENTHDPNIKKNVLVLGGLAGDFSVSAITIGSVIERLVYDNDEKYNLTIVPWLNVWGGMQNPQQKNNSNNVDLQFDFKNLSQIETQYLDNLIISNGITDIVHIDNKAEQITGKINVLKQEGMTLNFSDDGVIYTNSVTESKILVYAKNKNIKCISIGSSNISQFGQILYLDYTITFSKYAMGIVKGLIDVDLNTASSFKSIRQVPVSSTDYTSVSDFEELFTADDDGVYMVSGTVMILKENAGQTFIAPILLKENDHPPVGFSYDEEYTDLTGRVQLSFQTLYQANKGDKLKFALYVKTSSAITIYRVKTNKLFVKNSFLGKSTKS